MAAPPHLERHLYVAAGVVQGVGFRPFVVRVARALELGGSVRNAVNGVAVVVEGPSDRLARFAALLIDEAPPLARGVTLGRLGQETIDAQAACFVIAPSEPSGAGERTIASSLPADVPPCDACLTEMRDPSSRRYRYPLISCCSCGPRYSVSRGTPFDRERTSLAPFPLCSECQAELEDPQDRRFHAQTLSCPACGPPLRLVLPSGPVRDDVMGRAARLLLEGEVLAVKGVGGFHLVADATSSRAVERIKAFKARGEKPLAVLVAGLEEAAALAELTHEERALLASPERPIVLVRRRRDAALAEGVLPEVCPRLGLFLPPSPLHVILAEDVARPLIATSGNARDEPIAQGDEEAFARLGDVAAAFLTHERAIAQRSDDSVADVVLGAPRVLRRARGYVPRVATLPHALAVPTLAVGGELKNTVALGVGRQVVVSHHLGDLESTRAIAAHADAIAHLEDLFGVRPERIVVDRHPDLAATRYAERRSAAQGLQLIEVPHHQAHFAAALAEHGEDGDEEPPPAAHGRAVGVVFDGFGLGPDDTAWGGEILVGDAARSARVAHLLSLPLPGGDVAAREPWRIAVALCVEAGVDTGPLLGRFPHLDRRRVDEVARLAASAGCPRTTSMGRLFDGASALLGLSARQTYEAEAACRLEWAAHAAAAARSRGAPMKGVVENRGPVSVIDWRPWVAPLLGAPAGCPRAAEAFHRAIVDVTVEVAARSAKTHGLSHVVLSGGCFQNRLLVEGAARSLRGRELTPVVPRSFPPSDGGLALGQLAAAAALDAGHS